ncbi:SURF1 family protein [Euzebya tangerina]|uniref:SURF1 family protein n=1 Tax=Euzebya tangerina TaxID=591198 RepID=UPI000E30CB2F|nr:SURF1 family protein [Euzebya tangerina]
MRSMLLKPGWIATHIAVIAIAIGLINLGLWQLDRQGEVDEINAQIEAVIDSPPVPLSAELLRTPIEYQPVTVEGAFAQDADVSLSPRSRNGRPGYEVLTPFTTTDRQTVLVNRGWVPLDDQAPRPPAGDVTIQARLRQPTPARQVISDDDGTVEVLGAVDLDELRPQVPDLTTGAYVEVIDEEARLAGAIPRPADPPALDSGNHVSYAMQWFAFTLIGLIGYPLLLRRRMAESKATADDQHSRPAEPASVS